MSSLAFTAICAQKGLAVETLRHPLSLEQQLKNVPVAYLAEQTQLRGDAQRGALVFYKSAAACVNCHSSGEGSSPLGPNLAEVGKDTDGKAVSDQHLIESLLYPSRSIRKGFETVNIVTSDGDVVSGMQINETSESWELRDAADLTKTIVVNKDDVETVKRSDKSMMPEGLMATIASQRDFLDLAAYVFAVARGGVEAAESLRPTPEQIAVKDDSINLDHAGIIQGLRAKDYTAGEKIYHGYCFNCHGNDGNTPSLPTARAFGKDKLKFGADPYKMFMTLTNGSGLMAPMSHLTPKERYQVVHYIREAFMKDSNPEYFKTTKKYLADLPVGTRDGTDVKPIDRDFGPALASQLQRKFSSVLTIPLGDLTVSYDLHTMNQAGVWMGGVLDLSQTQHARDRGEGTADPAGDLIESLSKWQWGHDGTLDYPRDGLRPRGPLPSNWLNYRGHYLHGKQVVLSFAIDGREILEYAQPGPTTQSLTRTLRIGAGPELIVEMSTAKKGASPKTTESTIAVETPADSWFAAEIDGERQGMQFGMDEQNRVVLRIAASDQSRLVSITTGVAHSQDILRTVLTTDAAAVIDPATLRAGGPKLWPDELTTVGTLGLEQGAYALDTLTIPDSTPWITWFRTSALDFFADGRMALATYGGDVWIVSGIDDDLRELKWKRFAGGLYEPMGLRVVDEQIYVTCKDRLTRLHDADENGEADFYESFNADEDVSVNFHAFNFDLQTDAEGNFYYAKSGHGTDSDIPGHVVKISADGSQRSVYCTGFRTPNGMGSLPDGRLTASDNQGQWTPAGKINLLRSGGYYGWVGNYSIPGMWEPGGGKIDIDKVVPRQEFDPPLVWMPQDFDNSSGGQIDASDPRFGPLHGRLLHTSFGKGWMSYLMMQDFGDVAQAAIIKLPFDFQTGIMRGRTNPHDGQIYATGLQGWNGGGRVGLLGQGVQRLRYTGKPLLMVSDCQVEPEGLRLTFNFQQDSSVAANLDSYQVKHWNYKREKSYGSDQYSPSTGKKGAENMNVVAAELSDDGRSVLLKVPDLQPVDQVHIIVNTKSADGPDFAEEIFWTINQVPANQVPANQVPANPASDK
ncbi:DUF6797 domain-containing protein [Stieleria marina]|uniref:DUF6797 domain-containing protein n=1 Tax=Stieleria marina TaxID=1930275 RepID=UPI003AF38D8D